MRGGGQKRRPKTRPRTADVGYRKRGRTRECRKKTRSAAVSVSARGGRRDERVSKQRGVLAQRSVGGRHGVCIPQELRVSGPRKKRRGAGSVLKIALAWGQWPTGHGVTVPKVLHIRGRQGTRRAGTGMEALESRNATPLLLCEFLIVRRVVQPPPSPSASVLCPRLSAMTRPRPPPSVSSESPVTASGLRVLDGRRDGE